MISFYEPIQSKEEFGQAVRVLRTMKKWTQDDLAQVSGVSQQSISNIEKGIMSPSFDTMVKVLTALDMNLFVGVGRSE